MKLTQTAVAKFKFPAVYGPDHKRAGEPVTTPEWIEWDETMPGFGLRCRRGSKGESRSYVVQYKIGAKNRRLTLGNANKVDADTARSKAKQIFGKLIDGVDPANEKAKVRADANLIVKPLIDAFLEVQKERLKPAYYDATRRYLNDHWKPLHGLAVGSVDRSVVAATLRVIERQRGPISMNRARVALSMFYGWCIGEGVAESNPVIGTNKSDAEVSRDRVLSDAELAAIWNQSGEGEYGRIIRLLMLTAQRRDEIGGLSWSEVDLDAKQINLPGSRTKNGRDHMVPLSDDALAIIQSVSKRAGRARVFGIGEGGFSGWSTAKASLDESLGDAVSHWTVHDLRRTAATRMADCGVLPHVIEAVLNHVSGHKAGVAGIYNRATYADEKRAALNTLASYIRTAVAKASGANVTRLVVR